MILLYVIPTAYNIQGKYSEDEVEEELGEELGDTVLDCKAEALEEEVDAPDSSSGAQGREKQQDFHVPASATAYKHENMG
jgi:hypothetical protein